MSVADSLLGEHWTRASNVVVRRSTHEVTEDYSPRSDAELADFQLEVPREARDERRKSRRISSLREKSEQDLQQLRRASQMKSGSPQASSHVQRPLRKARKSKEKIDPASVRGIKVANMLKECLQIANFRLLETAHQVSEKLSAGLQNTRNPSAWPAYMAPMLHGAPSVSAMDLESLVPSKRISASPSLPLQWFQVKLVKVHAFNERLERRRLRSGLQDDPEMLHMAFQDAMEEARRIQAQVVTAKNELCRLKRAVKLQRSQQSATLSTRGGSPKKVRAPVTLPSIVVTSHDQML